jgi:hypothetical protein
MNRSALAKPEPIGPERGFSRTGVPANAGTDALSEIDPVWISAGETIRFASSVRMRMPNNLARMEASMTRPSESCFLPSGTAVAPVVGDAFSVRLVARAVFVETL